MKKVVILSHREALCKFDQTDDRHYCLDYRFEIFGTKSSVPGSAASVDIIAHATGIASSSPFYTPTNIGKSLKFGLAGIEKPHQLQENKNSIAAR